jgi:hypothetical protein
MIAFLLIAIFVVQTFCWGPLTHYNMGCNAIYNTTNIENCFANGGESLRAMALPDAFFFGASMTTGTSCQSALSSLHDPTFAGS